MGIVDRKKNLVKLKGGEYVALEKMNTAYNNSPFVNVDAGGACCFADDSLDRAVAIAQCKESEIKAVGDKLGLTGTVQDMAADPKVQAEVLDSFKKMAKAAGLTSLENVVGVYPIVGDDWSAANGCLTATQKLVPKKVLRAQCQGTRDHQEEGQPLSSEEHESGSGTGTGAAGKPVAGQPVKVLGRVRAWASVM